MLETAFSLLLRAAAAQQVAREARGLVGRLLVRSSVTVLGAICIVAAFGCALTALWIYAIPRAGPALAPVIVAGVLLCVAALLLLFVRLRNRPRARRADERRANTLSGAPASASGTLRELLRGDGSALLVAAILAGLVLGTRSSRGRKDS